MFYKSDDELHRNKLTNVLLKRRLLDVIIIIIIFCITSFVIKYANYVVQFVLIGTTEIRTKVTPSCVWSDVRHGDRKAQNLLNCTEHEKTAFSLLP